MEAGVFHEGLGVSARIKNMSHFGALLAGRYVPPIGSRISVITREFDISATVVWIGADRYGVLFDHADPDSPLSKAH